MRGSGRCGINESHGPRRVTTESQEEPMLLTVEQAAEQLGTSVRFIRRLRTQRRLAFIKLGSHLRVDSNDLDAYIHANREEAVGPALQRGDLRA